MKAGFKEFVNRLQGEAHESELVTAESIGLLNPAKSIPESAYGGRGVQRRHSF